MRDDQLRRLVGLASDKREAERIYGEIQVLEDALSKYDLRDNHIKYAKYKSPTLAMTDYLREVGHPVEQDHLIRALIAGGFRLGGDKVETEIKQAIASFTRGLGRKTQQIKMIRGLIGLGEWDDSQFVR